MFGPNSRLQSRGFVYRVHGRASYRRDEFALYFRAHGTMYYVLPSQAALCGRKACWEG